MVPLPSAEPQPRKKPTIRMATYDGTVKVPTEKSTPSIYQIDRRGVIETEIRSIEKRIVDLETRKRKLEGERHAA